MNTRFFKPMTVTRSQGGQFVEGIWQNGITETITVPGIIQRHKSLTELKKEFSGRSLRGAIKIFTNEPLEFGKNQSGADFVEHQGEKYEVVKSWTETELIPHVVSIAVMFEGAE